MSSTSDSASSNDTATDTLGSGTSADAQGGSIKVTVNTPLAMGAAITFDAPDYKSLYAQVKARSDSNLEAGHVERGWSASYDPADTPTKAVFNIPLTMSLPNWTNINSDKVTAEQRTKYQSWAASIRTHEDRHVEIYRTEYAKLKTAVIGPSLAECESQADAVDTNAESEQKKFDAASQPAGLPIPGGTEHVGNSADSSDGAETTHSMDDGHEHSHDGTH